MPDAGTHYDPIQLLAESYHGPLWRAKIASGAAAGSFVTLRVLELEADEAERVAALARAATGLEDESLLALRDVQSKERGLLLAGQDARGLGLRALLERIEERAEPPPVGVALRIALDILTAVRWLHAQREALSAAGFGFGGLTPDAFVLCDDGVTRMLEPGLGSVLRKLKRYTQHQQRLGYDAPEVMQVGIQAAAPADVFSVGAILWELARGQRLYAGNVMQVMAKLRRREVPRADEGGARVPTPLADIIHRALAPRPGERFAGAAEMHEALEGVPLPIAERTAVVALLEDLSPEILEDVPESVREMLRPAPQTREADSAPAGVDEPKEEADPEAQPLPPIKKLARPSLAPRPLRWSRPPSPTAKTPSPAKPVPGRAPRAPTLPKPAPKPTLPKPSRPAPPATRPPRPPTRRPPLPTGGRIAGPPAAPIALEPDAREASSAEEPAALGPIAAEVAQSPPPPPHASEADAPAEPASPTPTTPSASDEVHDAQREMEEAQRELEAARQRMEQARRKLASTHEDIAADLDARAQPSTAPAIDVPIAAAPLDRKRLLWIGGGVAALLLAVVAVSLSGDETAPAAAPTADAGSPPSPPPEPAPGASAAPSAQAEQPSEEPSAQPTAEPTTEPSASSPSPPPIRPQPGPRRRRGPRPFMPTDI